MAPPKRLLPSRTTSSAASRPPHHPHHLPTSPHPDPSSCPAMYFLHTSLALHSIAPKTSVIGGPDGFDKAGGGGGIKDGVEGVALVYEQAEKGPEQMEELCRGGVVYEDDDVEEAARAMESRAPTHSLDISAHASPIHTPRSSFEDHRGVSSGSASGSGSGTDSDEGSEATTPRTSRGASSLCLVTLSNAQKK